MQITDIKVRKLKLYVKQDDMPLASRGMGYSAGNVI